MVAALVRERGARRAKGWVSALREASAIRDTLSQPANVQRGSWVVAAVAACDYSGRARTRTMS